MFSAGYDTRDPGFRTRVFPARDPRVLIGGFALIALSVFLIPSTRGLFVVLLYVILLHRFASLPFASLLTAAKGIAPFIVLVVVINAVLVEGRPFPSPVAFVSHEGVSSGIHASVRVLALYLGMVVFLGVAPAEEIAKGISGLLAPLSPDLARRAAMYGFLSAGFIPLFGDEVRRIAVAQRFRGGGIEGNPLKKLRGVRLLVVPLVLSAVHRSAQLAMIVELRQVRTRIAGILVLERVSQKDYLFLVTTAGVVAAAWIVF